MNQEKAITLTGSGLTTVQVASIAAGAIVIVSDDGLERMARTRAIIEKAASEKRAIYGVTTGLGPKVTETLSDVIAEDFSMNTIRGRSHGVGEAMPANWVRAGMAVRLNTLLSGAAGARPELARHLSQCLNRRFTPMIPQSGSIGVADLNWGGAMGRALTGEGMAINTDESTVSAASALAALGIKPYPPALREGLALVSHSCFTGGIGALAHDTLHRSYQAAQITAALSMEGFRANLSALDNNALMLRPQQGQQQAAAQLLTLLEESPLQQAGAARRLQDPLSIRNIAQVHGSVQACLDTFAIAVADEINGASDNPAVIAEEKRILSHGGYLPVYLGITLSGLLHALVHLAALQVSRISKLLFERFSGLGNGLTNAGTDSAGLAPVMKTAESLYAEIAHLANPPPIYPGISADGLEDVVTHAAIPVRAAMSLATRLNYLSAIESIVALQAIDKRELSGSISPALTRYYNLLRTTAPIVEQDRPLCGDLERLAALINNGKLTL